MRRILHVVGARPNFMKAAPALTALAHRGIPQLLVHTGQHYDRRMSDLFFEQLGLPEPDYNLGVGSGSHAQQTAQIMMRFEEVVEREKPGWVLVYGDVNSTVAATLVCAKLGIRVAHVEAGLRSNDRRMPEEINRLVTDTLADLLFTPSEDGNVNLAREGVDATKICLVGNLMIDTLIRLLPHARWPGGLVVPRPYVLVTLHRPSNVDEPDRLRDLWRTLVGLSRQAAVVFPVHPRTRSRLSELGLGPSPTGLHLIDPLGYLEFLALQRDAALVITDSGGVQEETTYLGVPCITVRENTERPVTITLGSNLLVGSDGDLLQREAHSALAGEWKRGVVPPLWDGHAGERVARRLLDGIPGCAPAGSPCGPRPEP
ncbi:MAG: UDP-N-acetylglucosamine 2-epimerase (non-hydrolyzing) [Verrucomicrobiales bacterium]|nr:UDP-N-acetylglucosamine 2-epimerase (non-hydrolyzing) [Planctomycetota bacterium]MCP5523489.1 UDP-N-acetylglucosamine 2-epimerase (non-hydrolyzing) [Verrucomicrobiales bacterium]